MYGLLLAVSFSNNEMSFLSATECQQVKSSNSIGPNNIETPHMTTYEAERNVESAEDELRDTGSDQPVLTEPVTIPGSAAFQAQYAGRDTAAGLIAGSMAIPLTVGIA
ncbi:MAG: hypothetical protein OEW20_04055, partial [Nitrospira sp.]|nr:hypothetical protein [Nitrospira sp.]